MKALVVASGIVFWTLVLGIAWLAFFPGSDADGPVAILQIEPGPATDEGAAAGENSAETPDSDSGAAVTPDEEPAAGAAPAEAPAASGGNMDMPPGFAVAPGAAPQAPLVQPPSPGQMLPSEGPDAAAPGGRQGAAEGGEETASTAPSAQDAATPEAGPAHQQLAAATPPPPPPLETPAVEPGAGPLPPVPVAELVEDSQYGPLPKVAADGRRPLDVYARPSRYASNAPAAGTPPRIAILVTGLGLPDSPPGYVLKGLPPSISVAFGAYGRSLQDGVTFARADGHEVLLQIPLEPNNYPTENPGPHTLLTTLPPEENMKRLQWLMSRYTGYVGVTNLMGGKFEATQNALTPVLEEVKSRGLLYVDDGSVQGSTAGQIAGTIGLDYSVATVQIDANASPADIAKQLAKLEFVAKEKGAAIGVVKAKPATVKQLAEWAGKLQSKGFVLVPVSAAVRSQSQS